jgi:outer membrane biosynthesis protein TonB
MWTSRSCSTREGGTQGSHASMSSWPGLRALGFALLASRSSLRGLQVKVKKVKVKKVKVKKVKVKKVKVKVKKVKVKKVKVKKVKVKKVKAKKVKVKKVKVKKVKVKKVKVKKVKVKKVKGDRPISCKQTADAPLEKVVNASGSCANDTISSSMWHAEGNCERIIALPKSDWSNIL